MNGKLSLSWLFAFVAVGGAGLIFAVEYLTTSDADPGAADDPVLIEDSPLLVFERHNELLQFEDYNASFGVALADADGDGDTDLWMTQHGGGSIILRNRVNEELASFERIETHERYDQHGVTWVDLDRDGHREVLVMHGGGKGGKVHKPMNVLGNRLMVNEGAGTNELRFVYRDKANSESDSRGLYYSHGRGRNATFLDVNQDGLLDVFLGNEPRPDHGYPSVWFIQQSDHTFVRDREVLGIEGQGLSLAVPADFDGDGRMDLFLKGARTPNAFVLGDRHKFKDASASLPESVRKKRAEDVIVADFNGDLRPDVWLVAKQSQMGKGGRDLLMLNTSAGFINASRESRVSRLGFNSRNATAGDFDNDGDIDVYEVNSDFGAEYINQNLPNVLWENVGNSLMTIEGREVSVPQFVAHIGPGCAPSEDNGLGFSVAMGEFNGDGLLDLIVANGARKAEGNPIKFSRGTYDLFLAVDHSPNAWLMLELVGTRSNNEGIGAVVYATVNNKTWLRTADHGIHEKTQNDPRLHFGFGPLSDSDRISLEIKWPSGLRQVVNDVEPNQVLKVIETDSQNEL
ncbi:MAG: CRTAC1 family protein [Planctomycetaceae bacterium]|nr:CRTAC1 family protein [Planctomycetaceae bacterium]